MNKNSPGARSLSNTRRWSRTLSIAAVVLFVPTIAACTQLMNSLPEPIEYQCTWTNDAGDTFTLDGAATATLAVSGALLNETVFADTLVDQDVFMAEGRWEIGNGLYYRDYRGDPAVTLYFETQDGPRSWTVSADRRGGELVMLAPEPDPDEWDRMVFTSSDCFQEILDQNE